MVNRVVCVGNRYHPEDSAGPRVYDLIARNGLPAGVEAVDGGLAGLDLFPRVEGADRVVFVDAAIGFDPGEGLVVTTGAEAARTGAETFGHSAGIGYLIRCLPYLLDHPAPEILVVGVPVPFRDDAIREAARIAPLLAAHGIDAMRASNEEA
ncbi:MAG: hydrogenase maturation protease [Candidatus Eisenbacteria bacterium]|nr:hydrogenase maturation protease [Candidatus Eisenbacteria bacterium]